MTGKIFLRLLKIMREELFFIKEWGDLLTFVGRKNVIQTLRLEAEQAERAAEDARLRELYPLPEDDLEYGEEQYEGEDLSDDEQLQNVQEREISANEERKR